MPALGELGGSRPPRTRRQPDGALGSMLHCTALQCTTLYCPELPCTALRRCDKFTGRDGRVGASVAGLITDGH